jgi:hypothetical protein
VPVLERRQFSMEKNTAIRIFERTRDTRDTFVGGCSPGDEPCGDPRDDPRDDRRPPGGFDDSLVLAGAINGVKRSKRRLSAAGRIEDGSERGGHSD